MIEAKNLSFRYAKSKKEVFSDFNLTLQDGHIYGLLGKNGAGKSTLLYLLTGLLRPMRGEVTYDGMCVSNRDPMLMRDIFIIPDEEFRLPPVSLDNFIQYNAPFYPNFNKELLMKCLADFEMPTTIAHLDALSHGQKKKVFISFALATCTRVLVMDEPTNGLDIPSKSSFRKVLLSHMDENRILIISTHQVRDVEQLLDDVIIVDESRVLLDASIMEVTRKLLFKVGATPQEAAAALYAQPTIQGNYIVMENTTGEESQVNMEMLFNAVLINPAKIDTLFKN